ncbi:MAG: hypothetical protein WBA13_16020 [Microcoleaceae cyanobacterium]
MKPTDFDELFWLSDPESMGRVISEKYNINDFYCTELRQTLYKQVFCRQKTPKIPQIQVKKSQQLKHSF